MFLGLFAIGVAFGLFSLASSAGPQVMQFKEEHPVVSLFALLFGAYMIVYLLDGIVVFLLGILLPFAGNILSANLLFCFGCVFYNHHFFLATFIHASLRLRNIRNKLTNKMEQVGLKKSTPMGIMLNALGFEAELID